MKQNRSLKRSILLIKYLSEEESHTSSICDSAKSDMEAKIKMLHYEMNVFDESFDSQFHIDQSQREEKIEENEKPESQKIEDFEIQKRIKHPGWVKQVFKKIVFVTHPDKIPDRLNTEMREMLIRSYREAKIAFDLYDYVTLSVIACDIGINIDDIKVEDLSIFDKKESEIKHKINSLKRTIFWVWAHSSEEERKKIINEFIKSKDWTSTSSMRNKSRKGPGNHPGKSISWARSVDKKS